MKIDKLFARMENDPKNTERYDPAPELLYYPDVRALWEKRVSARLAADYLAERCIELEKRCAELACSRADPIIVFNR